MLLGKSLLHRWYGYEVWSFSVFSVTEWSEEKTGYVRVNDDEPGAFFIAGTSSIEK